MSIPAGVIVMWPSTAASIPAGWSRVASLDARFTKGSAAGVNPDVPGGSATHTHVGSHTHTIPSHEHSWPTVGPAANGIGINGATPSVTVGGAGHSHTASGSVASTTGLASGIQVWPAVNHVPEYYDVIYIQSNGTPSGIPIGAVVWYDGATPPTDWIQHASGKARVWRGAVVGGDAGGVGGVVSHLHTDSGHTHNYSSHAHANGNTLGPSGTTNTWNASANNSASGNAHTHSLIPSAGASGNSSSTASSETGSTSAEPPFHTLLASENDAGGPSTPLGIICFWTGLIVNIPSGWVLCDGASGTPDLRGRYIKAATVGGDVGDVGGATTHDHTDPSSTHTHTVNHSHPTSTGGPSTGGLSQDENPVAVPTTSHTHSVGATGTGGGTGGNGTMTVANGSSEPSFLTVLYIQLQQVLEVTIDAPVEDETVTIPNTLIDWSISGGGTQVDFRVRIYTNTAETQFAYDSGTIASATTSHTVPIGNLQNNTDYYLRVDVTDNGSPAIEGTSEQRHFETSWTPPNEVADLTLTPVGGI